VITLSSNTVITTLPFVMKRIFVLLPLTLHFVFQLRQREQGQILSIPGKWNDWRLGTAHVAIQQPSTL
jgi:hypothetical protein